MAALCRTKSCENALQRRIRTCGSPMEEHFPPDMQDPGNVAVRLDLCKMDASWNSVPDANYSGKPGHSYRDENGLVSATPEQLGGSVRRTVCANGFADGGPATGIAVPLAKAAEALENASSADG
ncbi:hypothetical protein GGI35DRAFT_475785 [Trichoderma velutinum]